MSPHGGVAVRPSFDLQSHQQPPDVATSTPAAGEAIDLTDDTAATAPPQPAMPSRPQALASAQVSAGCVGGLSCLSCINVIHLHDVKLRLPVVRTPVTCYLKHVHALS